MKKAVVLFGGGLDAAAMVVLRKECNGDQDIDLHLLYIDYGAKAAFGEIDALKHYSREYQLPYQILDIPQEIFPPNPITNAAMTDDHQDDYLPGRNMVLAAIAFPTAVRLGAEQIWLGAAPLTGPDAHMLPWARDMQQPFVDHFNDMTCFAYGLESPMLRAPLLSYPDKKTYIAETYRRDPNLFQHTTSCYQSKTLRPCGVCAHCLARGRLQYEIIRGI